jgi:hypothetical protein
LPAQEGVMAELYNSELFVGRVASLRKILDWARDPNPSHRLWSIVGPPGIGKSYLLNRVYERLEENLDRLVFWMNAGHDLTTAAGLKTWLESAVEKARRKCNHVQAYAGNIQPDAMLQTLVRDLCERCAAALMPVLIVDSFDEIPDAKRDEWEERVLASFISRRCTRILLGRRDEYALQSPTLRWNENKDHLPVMTPAEGDDQLDRRCQYAERQQPAPSLPNDMLDRLKATTPKYPWNHPGINTYLFELAVPRQREGELPLLVAEDLHQCIIEVTRTHAPLAEEVFTFLVSLANQLDDEWTADDLMNALKVSMEDSRLRELFNRGIVFNIEITSRYQVGDGLRELLRAWQAMEAATVQIAVEGQP